MMQAYFQMTPGIRKNLIHSNHCEALAYLAHGYINISSQIKFAKRNGSVTKGWNGVCGQSLDVLLVSSLVFLLSL